MVTLEYTDVTDAAVKGPGWSVRLAVVAIKPTWFEGGGQDDSSGCRGDKHDLPYPPNNVHIQKQDPRLTHANH